MSEKFSRRTTRGGEYDPERAREEFLLLCRTAVDEFLDYASSSNPASTQLAMDRCAEVQMRINDARKRLGDLLTDADTELFVRAEQEIARLGTTHTVV